MALRHRLACLAACAVALSMHAGIATAEPPASSVDTPPAIADIPGLQTPRDDLLIAGQPGADAWPSLKAQGVDTVINLRPDAEMQGRDERAEVEAAGMAYHQVPVASADDLSAGNASRLWQLVEGSEGRVLAHCASGNRVGALLAIGAANEGGMSPQDALAFGKSAGLTSPKLEEEVRVRLGLSSAE